MSDITERLQLIAERLTSGKDQTVEISYADILEGVAEIDRLRSEKLELAIQIDGCVRVAADALKRVEVAEARLNGLVGRTRESGK